MKTYYFISRNRLFRLAAAFIVLVALAISAESAQDQHGYTFTQFDVAGFQDTFPEDNNSRGVIVGKARDANGEGPPFVRAPNGPITTFDAPGATLTTAFSINPAGAIAGSYLDTNDTIHGFLRAPNGVITTFDAPGAGTGMDNGTSAQNINAAGTIAGRYFDDNSVQHCFVRASNGAITAFDAPGAGRGPFQGTFPAIQDAINSAGAVTGSSWDANDVFHGFVRSADGVITMFDVPDAGTGAFQGTFPDGINDVGAITGYYIDNNDVLHGFLRTRNAW